MKNTIPEVDAYIDKSADFAQPVLGKLRELFHAGCGELEESIKWGWPFFEYKGIVGYMAAFKSQVSYGFWKAPLMSDPEAQANFDGFSPSKQHDYVEWLTEAKRQATRAKRLATAIEWMAVGKPRNWKYMKEYRQ